MVTSTDPGWLQLSFDFLMGVFDQVGLRKKNCKTVGMVCRPFRAAEVRADEACTLRVTGEGTIFKAAAGSGCMPVMGEGAGK